MAAHTAMLVGKRCVEHSHVLRLKALSITHGFVLHCGTTSRDAKRGLSPANRLVLLFRELEPNSAFSRRDFMLEAETVYFVGDTIAPARRL